MNYREPFDFMKMIIPRSRTKKHERARKPVLLLLIPKWMLLIVVCIQAQVAPPYLTTVTPTGAERGKKITFTVEGYNLSGATEVLWSRPGITASIVLNAETARDMPRPSTDPTKRYQGDRATRNRLQIEAVIAADAEIDLYRYRLRTPLGTTNTGAIYVGGLKETAEREGNDDPGEAQAIEWPTTITGEMQRRGDADYFRFTAKAGQHLVFAVVASAFGSKLDSVLTLFDGEGKELAANNDMAFRRDSVLAYRFAREGEYLLRLTDFEKQGMGLGMGQGMSKMHEFAYRLDIGELPYVTSIYPLGLRQNTTRRFMVDGYNLGATELTLDGPAQATWNESLNRYPGIDGRTAYNPVRLAVGKTPEIEENPNDKSLGDPQSVTLPVTINGRLKNGAAGDFFRFRARKGQALWLEVGAQRYGSPLDSVIEIYDSRGQMAPRAVLRCVFETQQTLNDRDSASRGLRILSWNGINADDFLLLGNELLQVDALPKGPDEDIFFKHFGGQRIGFLDTTPEAHAVNTPVYKVSIHPPGTPLPPNGLPQTTLYFRNDDGGPMYGKDSRMTFIAPADGEYTVRLRDVRGHFGDRYAYRLSIRETQPGFALSVDPENPNVPRGDAVPIHVTAFRAEGFDGEIEIKLLDLPRGFQATTGIIRQGVDTVTILLSADKDLAANAGFPLRVEGIAMINGERILHQINTTERIAVASLSAPPELLVWTEEAAVALEPGQSTWVSIKIKREQEFKGRIPFDIRNLPHGVIVRDVGLNGVMITEDETTQRFELYAEAWTRPVEQPVLVIGRIETASPQRSEFPARPFTLSIRPKMQSARQ